MTKIDAVLEALARACASRRAPRGRSRFRKAAARRCACARSEQLCRSAGRSCPCERSVERDAALHDAVARQATTWTGIASTTSLAMMTPRKRSGRRSRCCTALAEALRAAARAGRRSSRGSGIRSRARLSSVSASAPLPAPSSRMRQSETARAGARACGRRGVPSSGAVTKSPLGAELARAARVVAEARLVQRELHVAREGDPAAGWRRSPSCDAARARMRNLP